MCASIKIMSEIDQTEALLAQATFPSLQKVLRAHLLELNQAVKDAAPRSAAKGPEQAPAVPAVPAVPATAAPRVKDPSVSSSWVNIDSIAWDQSDKMVTIYVEGLDGVGKLDRGQIDCKFGSHNLDLMVQGLDGKNYRLIKDNLEKDVVPDDCKILVKANKIVIKLAKKKGEYAYENWGNLIAKKGRDADAERKKKENPSDNIMDIMKDMYQDGDDKMKKIIGEAMMKSQSGEKLEPPSPPGV
jgi:calcyclin binding protein